MVAGTGEAVELGLDGGTNNVNVEVVTDETVLDETAEVEVVIEEDEVEDEVAEVLVVDIEDEAVEVEEVEEVPEPMILYL